MCWCLPMRLLLSLVGLDGSHHSSNLGFSICNHWLFPQQSDEKHRDGGIKDYISNYVPIMNGAKGETLETKVTAKCYQVSPPKQWSFRHVLPRPASYTGAGDPGSGPCAFSSST